MKFLTLIAWIFAVLSTALIVLRIIGFFCYTELEKLRDNLRGVEQTYPITWPGILAIVCWAWIISGGF